MRFELAGVSAGGVLGVVSVDTFVVVEGREGFGVLCYAPDMSVFDSDIYVY